METLYKLGTTLFCSMSGRKLRLSVHRKNEKRTEHTFPVQISLQHAYSLMKVSLPLSTYEDAPLDSLVTLNARISASNVLPQGNIKHKHILNKHATIAGWLNLTPSELGRQDLVFCKLVTDQTSVGEDVEFNLKIHSNFTWTLRSFRRPIDTPSCCMLQQLSPTLSTVTGVKAVIMALQSSMVCPGNEDTKFTELAVARKGNFKDLSGES